MNNPQSTSSARSENSGEILKLISARIRDYRQNAGHVDTRIVSISAPVARGPVHVVFESPSGNGTRKTFTVLPDGTLTPASYWCEDQI
jgi:hypothetical protein